MNYDELLTKIFFDKNLKFKSGVRRKYTYWIKHNKYQNIQEYLKNRYSDWTDYHSYNDKETLWRIANHVDNIPICPICGNLASFNVAHYTKYCSVNCQHKDKDQYKKMVETQRKNLQAKYGTQYTNYGQLQQVKEKIKETTYKHYGVTSYLATKEAHQKYKEKTGYDNPMQNPEIQEKTKQTCIKNMEINHTWVPIII